MKIKRSLFQDLAFYSAVLIGLALLIPARAFATGSADSIERWNIAMTDFSAGLPLFDLPPFVEMRAYAMAHIAMLDAVKSASRPYNAGSTSVDAAVAAAAHDVQKARFGAVETAAIGQNPPVSPSECPPQSGRAKLHGTIVVANSDLRDSYSR